MSVQKIGTEFIEILTKWGASQTQAEDINSTLVVSFIVFISLLANFITKQFIKSFVAKVIKKSKNEYDDVFLEKKVFNNLSHLVPSLIIYLTIEFAVTSEQFISVVKSMCYIYMVVIILIVIISFFAALDEVLHKVRQKKMLHLTPQSDEYKESVERSEAIAGYIKIIRQVITIVTIIIGGIIIFSELMGQSPTKILTGLGALAAIIMLVFKDTILGFVASIQLSAYKMLKRGDWIAMPSRNADGTVIDISLSTVKVQNFDKTISTIPTYALVSESFTNWDGMEKAKGRRIKRAVLIDMKTVKFCTPEMLEKFKKIEVLKQYIESTEKMVAEYNKTNNIPEADKINGRRMTNLGTFRKYLEFYLKKNEDIHKDYMFLVRQLAPAETGIPIEIYVFTKTTAWALHEEIQADIFDHVLAVIPEFELQVFQNPSGNDFGALFGGM